MAPAKSSSAAEPTSANPMEKRCRMRDLNENITCKVREAEIIQICQMIMASLFWSRLGRTWPYFTLCCCLKYTRNVVMLYFIPWLPRVYSLRSATATLSTPPPWPSACTRSASHASWSTSKTPTRAPSATTSYTKVTLSITLPSTEPCRFVQLILSIFHPYI